MLGNLACVRQVILATFLLPTRCLNLEPSVIEVLFPGKCYNGAQVKPTGEERPHRNIRHHLALDRTAQVSQRAGNGTRLIDDESSFAEDG